MNQTDKNIFFLVASNCINKIYDIFLGIFLVSYLFDKTDENIFDIGVYHLVCYGVVCLFAYFTGTWLKRGNRVLMYQLGIVTTFLFLVSFIWLQNDIVRYIPLCGLAYGIVMSFKAFPFNLIVADNIPPSKMIAFKGYMESLKNIVRVAAPLLLGFFLSPDSYFRTVFFLAMVAVIEFILFTKIKAPARKELPPLNIREFWRQTKKIKFLHSLYQIEFCRGVTIDGTLGTVITLYIIYLFKTNFSLGIISSVFYGITIILNFLFGYGCRYRDFVKILVMAAFLVVVSLLLFVFFPNKVSFIFYNFSFVVATQFLRTIADINMFNISNLEEVVAFKNEYFVIRELFLGLGRMVSYGLLLLVGITGNLNLLKYFLVFLTLFLVIMSVSCIGLNKYLLKKRDNTF